MPSMKAIVTNKNALTAKYGDAGAGAIDLAVQRLITADAARGLTTVAFDLEDAGQMQAVGSSVVLGAQDERGTKHAIDAIHNTHQPDYIMLLDGPDVVPHVALRRIDGVSDTDTTTDSDLPYASPAAWSTKASAYLAVTRVVGRLPAARGEQDPNVLIRLIDHSMGHFSRTAGDYMDYFGITAQKWNGSSQLSLKNIFGQVGGLVTAPDAGHTGIDGSLEKLTHFINCHGMPADPRFYGEGVGNLTIAMESPRMMPINIAEGAVVVAECCFGAELYNYRAVLADPPICLTYLEKGACAVMGSTNTSYGPASSNGCADFIAQYFLEEILKGASTGRAMLQARQTFVQNQAMDDPLNLKTIAQFLLLGDPSLHPVVLSQAEADATAAADGLPKTLPTSTIDAESERKIRRIVLDSEGKALASSASKPGKRARADSLAAARFMETARSRGFHAEAKVFAVTGGASFRKTAKAFNQSREVAIITRQEERTDANGSKLFPSTRALVGHILGDTVFKLQEYESK